MGKSGVKVKLKKKLKEMMLKGKLQYKSMVSKEVEKNASNDLLAFMGMLVEENNMLKKTMLKKAKKDIINNMKRIINQEFDENEKVCDKLMDNVTEAKFNLINRYDDAMKLLNQIENED
jgi:ribosomal protein S17E